MSGRRKGFTGPGSGAVSFLRHKAGTLVILIWVGQARVPARKCPSLRKQAPAGEPPPHHANTARGGDPGAGATRVWSMLERRNPTGNLPEAELAFAKILTVRKIPTTAWVLALVSSGLQILTFPKPSLYFLCWIAMVPLLYALLRGRGGEGELVDSEGRSLRPFSLV